MSTEVTINGEPAAFDGPTSLHDVVARKLQGTDAAPSGKGIAVAVNQEVVPRGTWASTAVRTGDRIEILTATQGG
ncbi:sulfur carrier protein ThiS [Phytoactinopolyspora mesophila]|uniref:Sulfur carrier protein ThiS n=1 Tax=Phytoactinopolyspora mesophila TaxID=2650750 RepID=A0A7K3M9X9_9ACTN|nr:sulfur carrier protein ThiS [Phytoactinopolyspora mesophila]NDL60141.1 sulfur carrier protein ThiS [Phytoactinopolyspora mesophila]